MQANQQPIPQRDVFLSVPTDDTSVDPAYGGNLLADNGNGADSDPDGDCLTIVTDGQVVERSDGSSLQLFRGGSFVYQPVPRSSIDDTWTYTVTDGRGGIASAAIVFGNEPDEPRFATAPFVLDDRFQVVENALLIGNVTADNGNGADLDTQDGTNPPHIEAKCDEITVQGGRVTVFPEGDFVYRPSAGFTGTDGFTYFGVNQGGRLSGNATVTITVQPNLPPVAQDDRYFVLEDEELVGNVFADNGNGADADPNAGDDLNVADPGTFTTVNGGSVLLTTTGVLRYTAAPDFNGLDSFDYTLRDRNLATSQATVTIEVAPVNDPPVAGNDRFDVAVGGELRRNVLDNDQDPDNDGLSVTTTGSIASNQGAAVMLSANGSFVYTPPQDFTGLDTFRYRITDGSGGTAEATVTVEVVDRSGAANTPPIARDDRFTIQEDQTLTGNVLADNGVGADGDIDPGDAVSVSPAGSFATASGGAVTLSAAGAFSYRPAANFNGIDSFGYMLRDQAAATSQATVVVEVLPVNDPPEALADSFAARAGGVLFGNVLADNGTGADRDIDGDAIVATSGRVAAVSGADVTISESGSFAYTPPAGFSGSDGFSYGISDGNGGAASTSVAIEVAPALEMTWVVAAVLPSGRAVQVGTDATAFASIINGGSLPAEDCAFAPVTQLAAGFAFQTTDPLTNSLTGSENTPVAIADGAARTFVFRLTPSAGFEPLEVEFAFACANAPAAATLSGLNTLLLSASDVPVADIIAEAATAGNDGIVAIPGSSGTGAFAIATANVGVAATIVVIAESSPGLPVVTEVCETNPADGSCLQPPGAAPVVTAPAGATQTFAIFVRGTGSPIALEPASRRITVTFRDTGGVVRGRTSVAVQTR